MKFTLPPFSRPLPCLCALLVFLLLAAPAFADSFNHGKVAYDRDDYATALKIWQPLAAHGNPRAQFYLARMYSEGQGVKQDDAEALSLLRKSADQGEDMAQYTLGQMYAEGEGVAKNPAEAAQWYRKAAEQGDADAEVALGRLYESGEGVPKDHAAALHWLREAAEQGDTTGAVALSELYSQGHRPEQNYEEAFFWYQVAGKPYGGEPFGYNIHAAKIACAAHLTPTQKASVKKRVAAWAPVPVPRPVALSACTKQESKKADSAADNLKDWDALYHWYRKYRQCDNHGGDLSDSLAGTVAHLLTKDWKDFSQLAMLSQKHPHFRHFVLSYIDETMSPKNAAAIADNVQKNCPADAGKLCKSVAKRLQTKAKPVKAVKPTPKPELKQEPKQQPKKL